MFFLQLNKDGQAEIIEGTQQFNRMCQYSFMRGSRNEISSIITADGISTHRCHVSLTHLTLAELEAMQEERIKAWGSKETQAMLFRAEELNMDAADKIKAAETSVSVEDLIAALQELDKGTRVVIREDGNYAEGKFAKVDLNLHRVLTVDNTDYVALGFIEQYC